MNNIAPSRRDFLRFAGMLAVSGSSCSIANAASAPLAIRRDLATSEATADIESLVSAYEIMIKLPDDNPHSWIAQANNHGVPLATTIPLKFKKVWAKCQHGNWWFFPWHRAYLHFFERIVRKYSKNPTFALPYWYWDSQAPNQAIQRTLQKVFLQGGALYSANRSVGANSGKEFLNAARIAEGKRRAMAAKDFAGAHGRPGFGGPKRNSPEHVGSPHGFLENSPHDLIHGKVGGVLGTVIGSIGYMTSPNYAARDPLFWVHHSNIDRLWVEWQMNGNINPAEPVWLDKVFYFYDEDENLQPITIAQVLDTADLGYKYEMPQLSAPAEYVELGGDEDPMELESTNEIELKGDPLGVAIALHGKAKTVLNALRKGGTAYAQLTLNGVRFKGNGGASVDSYIDVYLNLPKAVKQPTPDDPHYAGTFSFFGRDHGHGGATLLSEIPIKDAVRQLPVNEWQVDNINVTLLRYPLDEKVGMPARLTIEKVTLDGAER